MYRSLAAPIVTAMLAGSCRSPASVVSQVPPLSGPKGVYETKDIPNLAGLGLFGVEVVIADIDADCYPDLVMSSGDVTSPQPIVLYGNTKKKAPFGNRPSWYSGNIAHRGALAVGDVNGDGLLDLVVPVLFDHAANRGSGALEVFLNQPGGLPPLPQVLPIPDLPLSVALADVDADGDLDAVVAGVHSIEGNVGTPAVQHVYFNHDQMIHTEDPWNGPRLAATSTMLADFDQDGWLDLVFGGDKVAIVRGSESTFRSPPDAHTSWLATPFNAAFGLSAGRMGKDHRLSLVVADNCRKADGPCELTGLWLFLPATDGMPSTSGKLLRRLDNGSHVRFFDGNNDGSADLVVTQLGTVEHGAPALLFQGKADGTSFGSPFTTLPFLGEGIAIGDPFREMKEETFATPFHNSVVTLPKYYVAQIRSVTLDGARLERARFNWVPGTNWLTVLGARAGDHQISVTYLTSTSESLVLASHDPRVGPLLMYSDYEDPDPNSKPATDCAP